MLTVCGRVDSDEYCEYMNDYIYRGGEQPSLAAFDARNLAQPQPWSGGETLPFSKFRKGMLHTLDQPIVEMRLIDFDVLEMIVLQKLEAHSGLTMQELKTNLNVATLDVIGFRSSAIRWEQDHKKSMVEVTELQPVKILMLKHLANLFGVTSKVIVPVNNRPVLQFEARVCRGQKVKLSGYSDLMIFDKNAEITLKNSCSTNELKKPQQNNPLGAGSGTGYHRDQSCCQCEAVQRSKSKDTISIHVTDDLFAGYITFSSWRNDWRGDHCYHITSPRTTDAKALVLFNLLLLFPVSLDAPTVSMMLRPMTSMTALAKRASAPAPATRTSTRPEERVGETPGRTHQTSSSSFKASRRSNGLVEGAKVEANCRGKDKYCSGKIKRDRGDCPFVIFSDTKQVEENRLASKFDGTLDVGLQPLKSSFRGPVAVGASERKVKFVDSVAQGAQENRVNRSAVGRSGKRLKHVNSPQLEV